MPFLLLLANAVLPEHILEQSLHACDLQPSRLADVALVDVPCSLPLVSI